MNRPWLSIVTITKGDPPGSARTLASAVAFHHAGAEHIVVDGTVDDIADRIESKVETRRADGVRFLHRPARGIADAFNFGIQASRGEWVWCLNGGDTVDPRLTPEFLAALLANSRSEVIIGGTTYAGEAEPRPHPPVHLRWPPFRSWIPHPSTLVRRRLFEQFGLFDERYTIAMDYEWWLRVLPTGIGVDVINVPVTIFAPGGISQRPEALSTLLREQRDALRRHQVALARSWMAVSARLLRAWFRSLFARRLARCSPSQ